MYDRKLKLADFSPYNAFTTRNVLLFSGSSKFGASNYPALILIWSRQECILHVGSKDVEVVQGSNQQQYTY